MQQNGGDQHKAVIEEAVEAAKDQAFAQSALAVAGGLLGHAAAIFLIPLLAIYAWNGMTPEGWVDLTYWPTVAGFFVIRLLINWVKAPR